MIRQYKFFDPKINEVIQIINSRFGKKIICFASEVNKEDEKATRKLNTMNDLDTQIQVGKFFFYPDVIEWGCEKIIESIDANYLIIDEIGILEFNGEGFLPALKTIDDKFQGHLIITIRSQLMNQLDRFLNTHLPTISKWKRTTV